MLPGPKMCGLEVDSCGVVEIGKDRDWKWDQFSVDRGKREIKISVERGMRGIKANGSRI